MFRNQRCYDQQFMNQEFPQAMEDKKMAYDFKEMGGAVDMQMGMQNCCPTMCPPIMECPQERCCHRYICHEVPQE